MTLSREIFRQYDVRGIVGRDLTADVAYALGRAYAAYLEREGSRRARSRSGATTGRADASCAMRSCAGSRSAGSTSIDVGEVPTPLLYWSLNNLAVEGGIQVTGSHNPPEYNGFKLSLGIESMHGEEIQEIYRLAVAGKFPSGKGTVRAQQVIDALRRRHRGAHGQAPAQTEGGGRLWQRRGRARRAQALRPSRRRMDGDSSARATGPSPTITPIRRSSRISRI